MRFAPSIRFAGLWGLLALLALAASSCRRAQQNDLPVVRILSADELGARLQQAAAPVTLVHVWATWCGPCKEELPVLLRVRQNYTNRGVDVILVSADAPDTRATVARFLGAQHAMFPSFLIDNPNARLINLLCTNWSGALPASFFFTPGGRLQRWWEGKAEYARYRETAEKLLEPAQKEMRK